MYRVSDEKRLSIIQSKIKKTDSCWLWGGFKNKNGYGEAKYQNKTRLVHRLMYELHYGEIPLGMCVCHKCDVPQCCNPDHLFLGTQQDNIADKVKKGRQCKGDTHPSKTMPWLIRRGDRHHSKTNPECLKKGEQHGMARLTEQQIRAIRVEYATGNFSARELGEKYGCSGSNILLIIKMKKWAHVK